MDAGSQDGWPAGKGWGREASGSSGVPFLKHLQESLTFFTPQNIEFGNLQIS